MHNNVAFDIQESIELMKQEVIFMSSLIIFSELHACILNGYKTQGTE